MTRAPALSAAASGTLFAAQPRDTRPMYTRKLRACSIQVLVALTAVCLLPALPIPAGVFQGWEVKGQDRPIELDTLPVLGSRVSAELPLRTRAVQILDRAALDDLPARNVADALQWAVGVELGERSPAQSDLSIRGAGFEQVLVLVNGVRMTDPQTGHFNLNLTVPLDRVERIEILRGPASALYGGDAVGGVVNVVTSETPSWSASLEGGSFGTISGRADGGSEFADGLRLQGGGEWTRSDGHREGTDYEIRQGGVELRAPFAGGRLSAEAGGARRAFGAQDFYAPIPAFETSDSGTLSVGWRPAPEARVRVEPRVSWRTHDDDFIFFRDDPSRGRNEHRSTQWSAEVVTRIQPASRVSLAGGGEVGLDELESTNLGDRDEARGALFVEGVYAGSGALTMGTGIRLDSHETWGSVLSPSASASYELTPSVRVQASAGRAFRGATWTERYYADPHHEAQPDLEPERSTSAEAGLEWSLRPGVEGRVTGFRRVSRDLIDWARPAGSIDDEVLWESRNVNRARFRGLEVEGSVTPREGTGVSLAGSFLSLTSDSDAAEGLESKTALRPLADRLVLEVRQRIPAGAGVSIRAVQGRRIGDATFRQVDMRVTLPFMNGTLHLDGVNLGDSSHPDIGGQPVAGRSFYLGYRMRGAR